MDDLERYRQNIRRIPRLTRDEEMHLGTAIQEGNISAIHDMVKANLRLLPHFARWYGNRGVDIEDLIGEGAVELLEKTPAFEMRGVKFADYVSPHIRKQMQSAVQKHTPITQIPSQAGAHKVKILKTKRRLEIEYGRTVSPEEAVQSITRNTKRAATMLQAWYVNQDPRDIHLMSTPMYDEPEPTTPSTALEDTSRSELREALRNALYQLPADEAEILRCRFGIEPYAELTAKEIGKYMGNRSSAWVLKKQKLGYQKLRTILGDRLEQFLEE